MAKTSAGRRLTERHRKVQLKIAEAAIKELLKLWPLLDIERLDETVPGWLDQVINLVLRYRADSSQASAEYYGPFKAAETGQPEVPIDNLVPAIDLAVLRTSIMVTGPLWKRKLIRKGRSEKDASNAAFVALSKSMKRHILNAGREKLAEAANRDEDAKYYARVTDGDPCYWCAMLASRGYVYLSKKSALEASGKRGNRQAGEDYHDGCGCTIEIAFAKGLVPPGRSQEFENLYETSTAGYSGKEAVNAFRRAYEGRD